MTTQISEQQKLYFECAHCKAGAHNLIFADHVEPQKNYFDIIPGEFGPLKSGDFINKACPDCQQMTLLKR